MPADLDKAFYTRMKDDATLTALLATFESEPAIFTDDRIPAEAEAPYIHSHGNVSLTHADTKSEDLEEITRDIGCYCDRGQTAVLNAIATRVHDLFHRHALDIDSATTLIAEVSGPIPAPTDEFTIGAILTVRLLYELS